MVWEHNFELHIVPKQEQEIEGQEQERQPANKKYQVLMWAYTDSY